MVMSWLLNRRRFTSTTSLSGGVLAEAVWERKVLTVLPLCIELMGKSEREGKSCCVLLLPALGLRPAGHLMLSYTLLLHLACACFSCMQVIC